MHIFLDDPTLKPEPYPRQLDHDLFLSAVISPAAYQTTVIKNGPAKGCPGQGLQIQEQFRMLGFAHTYSCSAKQSAPRQGPRLR